MQRLAIAMVLFLLIGAGCGQPAPNQSTSQTPEASTSSEITFGPGSFDLLDPAAGLTELSGYRATLILSFNGTRDGQPEQWTRTYEMRVSQNPLARQLTITGDDVTPADQWMAEIGGVLYELNEQGGCIASLSPEGGLLAQRWEPASFLFGPIGAEEAGAETVNGVPAKHYTFDQRALGQGKLTESMGEVWVADAGYVVKYILTTKGGANYFGEGIEGTLTHDYNLTEIDQPTAVELPEDCPPGLIDAPVMSDAQDVEQLPGVTLYRTASSIADVIAFYQDQLPGMGWQPTEESTITETFGVLELTQGDQQLSVIASPGNDGTTVRLLLGSVQSSPSTTITPTP
jgi:hypothetical protein